MENNSKDIYTVKLLCFFKPFLYQRMYNHLHKTYKVSQLFLILIIIIIKVS